MEEGDSATPVEHVGQTEGRNLHPLQLEHWRNRHNGALSACSTCQPPYLTLASLPAPDKTARLHNKISQYHDSDLQQHTHAGMSQIFLRWSHERV